MRVFQGVIQGKIDQNSNIHATSGHRIEWNKFSDWGITSHLVSKHFNFHLYNAIYYQKSNSKLTWLPTLYVWVYLTNRVGRYKLPDQISAQGAEK